jgi:ATP-binding cassette subfamily F protein 3
MALLSISNLQHAYGDQVTLAGVNLTVDYGEKIGLVGLNGCGKSTFMKMIAGQIKPDAGQIQLARGATAGYLAQEHALDPDKTLREEAASAFAHIEELHRLVEQITHDMQHAQGAQLDDLMRRYDDAQRRIDAAGGYAIDHKIDATLAGLGLPSSAFDVKVRDLSGGQKARLALARLLLSAPDLLMLDEPTNHLDIDGRQWLEDYLKTAQSAVILISHDRWLLNQAVSKIYEMSRGVLEEYPGNYDKYRVLRKERREFQQREYEKQRDRISKEQAFIDRYRAGQRARQAQGREKRLERYKRDELLDRPPEFDEISLSLAAKTRPGDMVLGCETISKNYDGKKLFSNFTIVVRRGDRIGIIGPNGAGKTTLVSVMLGKLEPDHGHVRVGAQVDLGYYHQTHAHLKPTETVIDYLQRVTGSEQGARDLAGAFLFSGDSQDKPLGILSGGERSRTVLAALMTGGHNLLVLDEPTNHLDIPSAERLEEALAAYVEEPKTFGESKRGGGTVLLITHDRMLLDNTVNQLLIFDGQGNVRHFHGTYSEFLRSVNATGHAAAVAAAPAPSPKKDPKPAASPSPAPKSASTPSSPSGAGGTSGGTTGGKPKSKSRLAHLTQQKLEQQIVEIEKKLAGLDQQLADPNIYRDGEKVRKLQSQRDTLKAELTPLEEEWASRA